MPRAKKDLQAARTAPNPPVDLWERLAELEAENLIKRPPNSFTAAEYGERNGFSRNKAINNLNRLAKLGKVRREKAPGSSFIYWFLC